MIAPISTRRAHLRALAAIVIAGLVFGQPAKTPKEAPQAASKTAPAEAYPESNQNARRRQSRYHPAEHRGDYL